MRNALSRLLASGRRLAQVLWSSAAGAPAFVVIGFIGLGVDLGVLTLMEGAGLPMYAARGISLPIAVCTTWLLNRRFTFEASGRALQNEALRYFGVSAVTQGFNYIVSLSLVRALGFPHLIAALTGSAAAMVASFLGYKFFAFAKRSM
jgi:putative flippase GtrA